MSNQALERTGAGLPKTCSITEFLNFPDYKMPSDPAHQLQQLYLAGFEFQTFERFPRCVGAVRDGCIALLVPAPDGLQILGSPGWQMGEALGVLVNKDGRQVFQFKSEFVEATPERLEALARFKSDLGAILQSGASAAR